jgi:hypothetical protein
MMRWSNERREPRGGRFFSPSRQSGRIHTNRGESLWQRLGASGTSSIRVFAHWLPLWAIAAQLDSCAHFAKGNGNYLEIQKKLFKGMRLDQIYKKASEHYSNK